MASAFCLPIQTLTNVFPGALLYPSISKTISKTTFKLSGTFVVVTLNKHDDVSFSVLDLESFVPAMFDHIQIACEGLNCIKPSTDRYVEHWPDPVSTLTLEPVSADLTPNVARALTHIIKLAKKQHVKNDPFAKPYPRGHMLQNPIGRERVRTCAIDLAAQVWSALIIQGFDIKVSS